MSKKSTGKQSNQQSLETKSKNGSAGKITGKRDSLRPPIVCFLGHVDHGKTTLLDYIRQTHLQAKEAGGITQAISAYHVDGITFIDTPGHEAFTAMRARGGQTADIAILVVAADAGVQPQTIEAINHIKAAGVPMLVAINKIDLNSANPDKVKQQLSENDILVEDWGGQVVSVECSGTTGKGIEELLDMIKLIAEMQEIKSDPTASVQGILIESTLDPRRGPLATIIIQQGTLRLRDFLVAGQVYGRIKSMWDWQGIPIKEVNPGQPAEVLGLSQTTPAGTKISVAKDEKEAQKQVAKNRHPEEPQTGISEFSENHKTLNLVIKASTQGSLDAILHSLESIGTKEVKINVLHAGLGNISEADTLLAQSSQAIILGFQTKIDKAAEQMIKQEKLTARTHKIIYHLLEDIEKLITSKKREGELIRQGLAEVLKVFTLSDGTKVAGCQVKEGAIDLHRQVRVLRGNEIIGNGRISSLKQEKEKINHVKENKECGLAISPEVEFQEGDLIETLEEAKGEKLL